MYLRKVPKTGEIGLPAPGNTILEDDNKLRQKDRSLKLNRSQWHVYEATVEANCSAYGWHTIILDGGKGAYTAKSVGKTVPWGPKTTSVYPVNSKVLVSVNDLSFDEAVILGSIDNHSLGAEDFHQTSFIGSWSGVINDPLMSLVQNTEDSGWVFLSNSGLMTDQLNADWRISNALGGYILCSQMHIAMVVDEITHIYLNTVEQEVEISGRRIDIQSDGIRLSDSDCAKISKFQLSGGLKFETQPNFELKEFDLNQFKQTDNQFVYSVDDEIRRVFDYSLYAMVSGDLVTHQTNTVRTDGNKLTVHLSDHQMVMSNQVKFKETSRPDVETSEVWPSTPEDRDQLKNRLEQWSEVDFPLHFQKPIKTLAAISKDFLDCQDHFVHVDTENAELSDISNVRQILSENESVQFHSNDSDKVFTGSSAGESQNASWITKFDDGSIFIGNELGAGIRIVGTNVFIEGATVRVAATKDLNVISRDVNILTNRNINLQSQKHIRIYAGINANLIGGISGRGGTLLESRGVNRETELPQDAEDALFSGIVMRAANSHAVVQGGDVILDSGVRGSGSVVIRSRSGMLLSTQGAITTVSQVNNMFYGQEGRPTGGHVFLSNRVDLSATFKARDGWFDGSVYARSNMQAVYGRMADSQGGRLQQVQQPSFFDSAMSNFQQVVSRVVENYQEFYQRIQENLFGQDRILAQNIRTQLAGGFTHPSNSEGHYGTKEMQPTLPSIFQSKYGITQKSMRSLEVRYREGGSSSVMTYGWPGNTSSIQVKTVTADASIYQSIRNLFTTEPTSSQTQIVNRSFANVFSTLGDNANE